MNQFRHIRSLTANELQEIKRCMKSSQDVQLRTRAHALWLSHDGYKVQEIARILARHPNSITAWFSRYESGGLAALGDCERSGRPPRAGEDFQKKLVQAVRTPPPKMGYTFTTWSAERLQTHMTRQTGVHVSEGHIRKLLKKNGIVFRKPKHDLKAKQDPALYSQKKELLEFVKKTQFPILPVLSFCFWTSAMFISILN